MKGGNPAFVHVSVSQWQMVCGLWFRAQQVKGMGTTESLKTRKGARAISFVTARSVNHEGHEENREGYKGQRG